MNRIKMNWPYPLPTAGTLAGHAKSDNRYRLDVPNRNRAGLTDSTAKLLFTVFPNQDALSIF